MNEANMERNHHSWLLESSVVTDLFCPFFLLRPHFSTVRQSAKSSELGQKLFMTAAEKWDLVTMSETEMSVATPGWG